MDQPKPIQIKASDEDLKGRYANAMQVSHGSDEFTLDFFNLTPPAGQLVARVITSPGHMKRILSALQENIAKYEAKFGPIQEAKAPTVKPEFKPS
jgi:hypothetical protein